MVGLYLGFTRPTTHHRLFLQTCYLQHDNANTLLQAASEVVSKAAAKAPEANKQQLTAFNPVTQQGFLRQLILRRNSRNEYMIIISTSSSQPSCLEEMVTALLRCNVPVLSIISTVIPGQAPKLQRRKGKGSKQIAVTCQQAHVLHGLPTITEQLCGMQFQISPTSFFQVNSDQAEVLYSLVLKSAGK